MSLLPQWREEARQIAIASSSIIPRAFPRTGLEQATPSQRWRSARAPEMLASRYFSRFVPFLVDEALHQLHQATASSIKSAMGCKPM
jgi:hypothetical protein